jgi:hypothetical protein
VSDRCRLMGSSARPWHSTWRQTRIRDDARRQIDHRTALGSRSHATARPAHTRVPESSSDRIPTCSHQVFHRVAPRLARNFFGISGCVTSHLGTMPPRHTPPDGAADARSLLILFPPACCLVLSFFETLEDREQCGRYAAMHEGGAAPSFSRREGHFRGQFFGYSKGPGRLRIPGRRTGRRLRSVGPPQPFISDHRMLARP